MGIVHESACTPASQASCWARRPVLNPAGQGIETRPRTRRILRAPAAPISAGSRYPPSPSSPPVSRSADIAGCTMRSPTRSPSASSLVWLLVRQLASSAPRRHWQPSPGRRLTRGCAGSMCSAWRFCPGSGSPSRCYWELAYGAGSERDDLAKIGVLTGSLIAATLAAIVLRLRNRHYRAIARRKTSTRTTTGYPTSSPSTKQQRRAGK